VERVATEVLLLEAGRAELVPRVDEAFARIGLAPLRSADREKPAGLRRSPREEERRRLRREATRARERADALAAELDEADRLLRELEARQCEPEVFSDPVRARAIAREVEIARRRTEAVLEAWGEAEESAWALEGQLAACEQDR
jgi:hypothetical protein